MKTPVFTGSCVAIVTPMLPDGSVHYEELAKLLDFQIRSGTDAIAICATTGESATLTEKEHRNTIEFTIKTVAGRIPVIAGTGSNDTQVALARSLHACEAGADAVLLVTPYYNKTTQTGMVKHFEYVADRISKPMIVYNVPGRTGLACTAETYHALSKHPMINGVKEAGGDFTTIPKTASLCGGDFHIWSGNDDQIVPILSLGGKGVISVWANIMPKECHEMVDAYLTGDTQKATKMQLRYFDLMNTLFIEVNPIPVKTALRLMGFDAGPLRMPLCEMSEEHLRTLRTAMKNAGLAV